ncbi:glycosyltransferase family 1 protein [Phaeocystidibacter luteus]|uniref:Glycosyltransferase family 1 protein n=2 Tax=Phaeocystidibacter luteus TaxID=911197 RepID=A0A6N6RMM5_9FLAO|nr:glycosyltransferase family 1 protein [Phaeocystidibacter luteus]
MAQSRFIFMAQQPMDTKIGSNAIDMAYEISKRHEVLYVNIPMDRITKLRNKEEDRDFLKRRKEVANGSRKPLEKIRENLWQLTPGITLESINTLPDGSLFDKLNMWNNRKLSAVILGAVQELGWDSYYLLNDSDMFRGYYMKELLNPSGFIYYSRDNLREVDYFKKHGTRIEPLLMAKADACVTNSAYLRDECAKFNANSYDIGQGCDLSAFDPSISHERPSVFPDTQAPIIGYVGALIELRLDIPLLEELAKRAQHLHFVFTGPQDAAFEKSKLHGMENVTFTGPCKPTDAPQFVSHFDVCINPQRIHPMTIGNYPRKIDEYLALGKPTVATLTRAMEMFSDHVYLAEDADGYLAAFEKALNDNSAELQEDRRKFALTHSWENSIEKMYEAMRSVGLSI